MRLLSEKDFLHFHELFPETNWKPEYVSGWGYDRLTIIEPYTGQTVNFDWDYEKDCWVSRNGVHLLGIVCGKYANDSVKLVLGNPKPDPYSCFYNADQYLQKLTDNDFEMLARAYLKNSDSFWEPRSDEYKYGRICIRGVEDNTKR